MGDVHNRGPAEIELARRIRLVMLDVDGVLTDGGIYLGVTDNGERVELKRFEIMDGIGIRFLREAGIEVAIITGRESGAVRIRAEELGIVECHQDPTAAKLPIAIRLLERLSVDWSEAAFVGDDLPDLPVLRRVALPAAVANAAPEVKAVARWTSRRPGGSGAIREFAELLLRARGEWTDRVDAYLAERSA
ncbi:MAG: HAD family hydrolase [Gemmatimonas sp.]|nr:HAD family hydrolase [Gemmatimonas sp.]